MSLEQISIPQYRQLYEIFKEQIIKGVYKPGDLLPSEHALCKTYHLTRPTIRQCLSELVNEGYIKKVKGKGSIVQKMKAGIGILNIRGTTESLPAGKLQTKVISKPIVGPWKGKIAFEISEEEREAGCIFLSRVRLIDEQAVFYEETYLPNINLPRFTSRNFNNKSLFNTLSKHYLINITGGAQRIRAIKAQGKIVSLLDMKKGSPVLHLEKKYETNRPFFHFYTAIWCRTDDYYLEGGL